MASMIAQRPLGVQLRAAPRAVPRAIPALKAMPVRPAAKTVRPGGRGAVVYGWRPTAPPEPWSPNPRPPPPRSCSRRA
jgi:hypothetical protein